MGRKTGFTLAEVLITLGVIGVVAAITMPVLMTNVHARVQKEQLRSAKYKLTLATDKMKSLGLLGETYDTTADFINELKKHYKIAKICDNSHLRDCWPTDSFEVPNSDGTLTSQNVNSIKTGADLKALGLGTKNTQTMGIITADGMPMILTYSPKCTPLDSAITYSWSTIDNKPETNATTNCISAIMDINGKGKPNRLGKDVRTWNSILGYVQYPATKLSYNECMNMKDKLGIKECYKDSTGEHDDDYFGGAVKKCHDIGLHLPSPQTLANIAGAKYGRSDIGPYTVIASVQYTMSNPNLPNKESKTCEEIWSSYYNNSNVQVICIDNGTDTNDMGNNDENSSLFGFGGDYWSSSEVSAVYAKGRGITDGASSWNLSSRKQKRRPLCIGD